jgi:hypothetical protein
MKSCPSKETPYTATNTSFFEISLESAVILLIGRSKMF